MLREHIRIKKRQNPQESLRILDSQSVQCGNNRALNSYDGQESKKDLSGMLLWIKTVFWLL